jgi:cytidylate kinase
MGTTITLSRQLGAGGEAVACGVAAELGLRVVGRGLVEEAIEGCVVDGSVPESEEERPHIVQRAVRFLQGKPAAPSSPSVLNLSDSGVLSTRLFDRDQYRRSVLESVIFDLTRSGDVLVVGQAGQVILRDDPGAFHVRIVAPLYTRLQNIRRHLDISEEEALQRIETSDSARSDYLRRHYGENIDDVRLYDLSVNTGVVTQDAAVRLVVEALRAAGFSIPADSSARPI